MPSESDSPPDRVGRVLGELERDIQADPYGRLSLGGRIRLWDAMRAAYGRAEADLRWSSLAYLVARDAASTWDPARLPRDKDFDRDFHQFPDLPLETARLFILGETSRDRLRAVFKPLGGYRDWPEVSGNDGYLALMELRTRLLGEEDDWYEDQSYFEVARSDDGRHGQIFEDSEFDFDTHYFAAQQASGPGYGEDRGGTEAIRRCRAFWLHWVREMVPKVLGLHSAVLELPRRTAGLRLPTTE